MTRRTSRKLRSNSRRRSAITSKASKPKKIKFHWPPAIDYDTRVALGLPVHGGKSRRTSRRRTSLRRNGSAYFFQGSPAVAEQKIHQIRAAGGSDLKATKRYDGIWTVTFNADAAAQNALFGGSASNPLRHRGSGYGIGTPMETNSRRRTSLRRNGVRSTVDHEASTELKIYVDNTYALYALKTAIEKNLSKKKASGKYDSSKAPKAFLYLADEGAKRYAKEFASPREAFQIFSAATRRDVAARLAKDFEDEYAIVHPNARRRTSRR
jgi:hypothetical protein